MVEKVKEKAQLKNQKRANANNRIGGDMLKRDDILKAQDLRSIDIDVPEWGGSVKIQTMTGAARQIFQNSVNKKSGVPDNMMERLIIATVIDDNGEPLFIPSDIPALAKKSAVALTRVFEAAAELNGLTAKAVDEIVGELEPIPKDSL